MTIHSFFDVNGAQLGDVFPMTTTAPAATSAGAAWANVFGQVGAGVVDYLKTKETRKLEEQYLRQQQIPPASLLAPGVTGPAAGVSNPWPLIAIGGALLLLMSRK